MMEDLKTLPDNVEVSYVLLPSPVEMIARISSGEVQGALLPLNTAAKLYTAGGGYPLAAVPGWGNLFLLSRDSSIAGFRDLEGKTVHTTGAGATPDYLFRYLARASGADINRINLDYSFPVTQLAQLAAAGRVNTALVPQPYAAVIQAASADMVLRLDIQEQWRRTRGTEYTYPMTAFTLSGDFAQSRPAAYRALLEAYDQSITWVTSHPEEAAALAEAHEIIAAGPARLAIPQSGLFFLTAQQAKQPAEDFLAVLLQMDPDSVGDRLPDDSFYLP
jgi:NitT/TauT family transport system substrate-binding protein